MNTNQLKKFAQATRQKLLEQISAKLEYVLSNETAELRERAAVIAQIKDEIERHGKQNIVDKIAYTWFNRFVALRYMDVNDYQPLGINIVTALPGQVSAQILQEAMAGNIAAGLKVDKQKVFGLLDGKIKSVNAENDAYRLLLIAACNHLHGIFPFLFEQIDDYTELLLPDDLTSQFSLLHDVVEGITDEDGKQVECIGWLYQFYISEKKAELDAAKKPVKKDDIPAATQLFTPRWIVEYMVQNTVGKQWLMNNPDSPLRQYMPYYIENEVTKTKDYLKINSPEELTLLDQACGSGHILVYGFELLYRIYEEQGYNAGEIPGLIIKHNLYGLEIDERAAQLSSLAILMKAREYQPRLFKKTEVPVPNIVCYEDLPLSSDVIKTTFASAGIQADQQLLHDLGNMQQATNLGSLIIPHSGQQQLLKVKEQLRKAIPNGDLYNRQHLQQIAKATDTLIALNTKYSCVVDNPPYMSWGMNKELSDFVKINYQDSKTDLMACFMEAGLHAVSDKGILGMINQHSWMFLSSYEDLRKKLVDSCQFDTLLHLGPHTFPEIGGEIVQNSAFTFIKKEPVAEGSYIRLVNFDNSDLKKEKAIEAIQNKDCGWFYTSQQTAFEKIPGNAIGYWASDKIINTFQSSEFLSEFCKVKVGLQTGDNDRFRRNWSEISILKSRLNDGNKWFPYNSGGAGRKWYGNQFYFVNWENDGFEIKNIVDKNGKQRSRPQNQDYYLKESVSWSFISSGIFGVRYYPPGFIFDVAGSSLFPDPTISKQLLGLLNSNIVPIFLSLFNPTLNYQVGDISKLPVFNIKEASQDFAKECIHISETEWNSRESSWDFQKNNLVQIKGQDLEETYDLYQQYWRKKFHQLHRNEEELNRQFIELYGLQDEVTPDILPEHITILKQETSIENGKLVFNAAEVFTQFVSYSVGCMFGRYSPDADGLILASQGETMKDYFDKTGSDSNSASFLPDEDNIIPVLDDEWFDDDIVASFHKFLKVTFGEDNFRKNLNFIEEQLGKDIRRYFVKDFYADHIQRYRKRPIYWMFSSPKGHFNVLVYLHRYTPDTLNNILNNYLREFIEKLRTRSEHLKEVEVKGSAAEKTKAGKELEKIKVMLEDCRNYERDILYPLATERIAIDLDNGVLVNYNCFGKAVKEVKGLNDTKTKNEVRKFDWIDTSMIQ